MEILDFDKQLRDEYGIQIKIHLRDFRDTDLSLMWGSIFGSYIKENGIQTYVYGNGNTIDEVLQDYCEQISGKELWVYSKLFFVPELQHTKLLNK